MLNSFLKDHPPIKSHFYAPFFSLHIHKTDIHMHQEWQAKKFSVKTQICENKNALFKNQIWIDLHAPSFSRYIFKTFIIMYYFGKRGAFFTYVDKILAFFDHLPTLGCHLRSNFFTNKAQIISEENSFQ